MGELTDDDIWLYAGRLEWYVSGGVPSIMADLEVEDRDEYGGVTGSRPMVRQEIYDLLARGGHDDLCRYARDMRTPIEEADRLVAIGAIDGFEELRIKPKEGDPDPYGGYRRRLLAYEAFLRGKGNGAVVLG